MTKLQDRIVNPNPEIQHHVFKPNGNFPNSKLPLLVYKNACLLGKQINVAVETLQMLFNKNGWKNSWANGIYTFHHFHSNTHECMGIAAGKAWVVFGGIKGQKFTLKKGDIIIIPAGLAHRCSKVSSDFLCVGAYPKGKDYDIMLGKPEELEKIKHRLENIPVPPCDPIYGKEGFLKSFWR